MESGTIEQSLPGLEGMTPQPDLEVGRAIALAPQKRLMLFSGRSNPDLAHADRRAARHRARAREAQDVRERRDVLPLRGVDPRRGHVHRPVGVRPGRPQPDGAADHDQRGAAGVGEADHGGHPLVLLRAPGQEVAAARADQRAPRRRHAAVRGRRPRAHHGPPRRPGAGLLPHPRRPHDGDPALRPVRPRSQAPGSPSPRSRPTPAGRSSQASSRR